MELIARVPLVRVVTPEYVLEPLRVVTVAAPDFVRVADPPRMAEMLPVPVRA